MAETSRSAKHPVFSVVSTGMHPTKTFIRGDRADPVLAALHVCGARSLVRQGQMENWNSPSSRGISRCAFWRLDLSKPMVQM